LTRKPVFWLASILALAALVALRFSLGIEQGLQVEYSTDPLATATPARTGVARDISAAGIAADWNGNVPARFRAKWFGYLAVGRAADYTFATTSDDGSTLSIDGQQVVDNGGVHGPQEATGRITLAPGPHFVLIEYAQEGGDFEMRWAWAGNGGPLESVPGWMLSPRRVSYERALTATAIDRVVLTGAAALALLGLWLLVPMMRAPIAGAIEARPRLTSLALFVCLALVETWPLASDPAHLSRNDNGDAMLNEWTIAWVAHQAPRDPRHLFDANIFYPERDTLAYSESMIVQSAMAAPFIWLGASPVLAYNIVLLAGFALTAWASSLVVARWTGDWTVAILAGTFAGFNAHTISRIPHLQAQHGEFLPLALFALDALFGEPRAGRALKLAGWFVLQALTSVYLLVFTSFALAAAALIRPRAWLGAGKAKVVVMLALSAGVSIAALSPFLLPYWRAYQDQGLVRSLDDARLYSASWADYFTTAARLHYALWSYRVASFTPLFPGAAALVLAGIAIFTGVSWRDARARMCLAMIGCGLILSFGPYAPGYGLVYQFVPLLHAVRAPVRFGYLVVIGIALLAAFGALEVRRRLQPGQWAKVAPVLLLLAVVEPLAAPLGFQPFTGIPSIYDRLADEQDAVVAELPFPPSRAIFMNARYMLNSTRHFKPMLNGYSGFVPGSYYEHYAAVGEFPNGGSIAALERLGVTHLIVHIDAYDPESIRRLQEAPELREMAREPPIAIYRLR
jgi:PA14 domain